MLLFVCESEGLAAYDVNEAFLGNTLLLICNCSHDSLYNPIGCTIIGFYI